MGNTPGGLPYNLGEAVDSYRDKNGWTLYKGTSKADKSSWKNKNKDNVLFYMCVFVSLFWVIKYQFLHLIFIFMKKKTLTKTSRSKSSL